jgi:hypothetical protein
MPYLPNTFEVYLNRANIMHLYPFLVTKLMFGYPLSSIPLPEVSYTPDSLSSLNKHVDVACKWIDLEIVLGHMAGPLLKSHLN